MKEAPNQSIAAQRASLRVNMAILPDCGSSANP
jgi:hypothetical protein